MIRRDAIASLVFLIVSYLICPPGAFGSDWFVGPNGSARGSGTKEDPWDLVSALGGGQKVAAGDTIWVLAGAYKHPNRAAGGPGFEVRLVGEQDRPIQVRAVSCQRATIDGGLSVMEPSKYLWLWDLEIIVSENYSMSRRVAEPGSSPKDYNRPWGGLNIHAGTGCKYINLIIHDNAQGVSFWSGATDSELYGLIIYDNGWEAPDRGHGHAIYTQNEKGTKTISDCIMTGGYGYTMHAYGSSRAYVDNYVVQGNVCYNGGAFLIGGGRPSRNIRSLNNYLYNVGMQLGYSAPQNEDCEVRGNLIVGGGLTINKFQSVVNEDNVVLGRDDPRPTASEVRVDLRPSRYDPNRCHVVVLNWPKKPMVDLLPASFLKTGDSYKVVNPRDFFGEPIVAGTFTGQPIRLPMSGDFGAFVLLGRRE
jgi:hypothetical protein